MSGWPDLYRLATENPAGAQDGRVVNSPACGAAQMPAINGYRASPGDGRFLPCAIDLASYQCPKSYAPGSRTPGTDIEASVAVLGRCARKVPGLLCPRSGSYACSSGRKRLRLDKFIIVMASLAISVAHMMRCIMLVQMPGTDIR